MKKFTFKYKRDLEQFTISEIKRVMKTAEVRSYPDTRFFDSLDELMRSASKARLELFKNIKDKKPNSLYELAQQVGKDQSHILREAKALENLGLIRLVSIKEGGREKLKPEALYDRIIIDVNFEPDQVA